MIIEKLITPLMAVYILLFGLGVIFIFPHGANALSLTFAVTAIIGFGIFVMPPFELMNCPMESH